MVPAPWCDADITGGACQGEVQAHGCSHAAVGEEAQNAERMSTETQIGRPICVRRASSSR